MSKSADPMRTPRGNIPRRSHRRLTRWANAGLSLLLTACLPSSMTVASANWRGSANYRPMPTWKPLAQRSETRRVFSRVMFASQTPMNCTTKLPRCTGRPIADCSSKSPTWLRGFHRSSRIAVRACESDRPQECERSNKSAGYGCWPGRRILTRVSRAPLRFPLPTPSDLRDEASREAACEVVARLCWMSCQFVEGRRRPSVKQSRHIARPLLFAPKPRQHFPRRYAERNFVMLLSIACVEATGVAASRTARHRDASRNIGPFARFVRECLQLVGAKDADAVELINELHRRRRAMERRTTSEGCQTSIPDRRGTPRHLNSRLPPS